MTTPTVEEHTHLRDYTGIAGCHVCANQGAINPDTLTPWPALDDHGERVLADADRRFHDRYDGPDSFASSLEVAVREAYLRGRMQGRREKDAETIRRAQVHERAAERMAEDAGARIGSPGAHSVIVREMADAAAHLSIAAGLREAVGRRDAQ